MLPEWSECAWEFGDKRRLRLGASHSCPSLQSTLAMVWQFQDSFRSVTCSLSPCIPLSLHFFILLSLYTSLHSLIYYPIPLSLYPLYPIYSFILMSLYIDIPLSLCALILISTLLPNYYISLSILSHIPISICPSVPVSLYPCIPISLCSSLPLTIIYIFWP